jgi:hypothetical protein
VHDHAPTRPAVLREEALDAGTVCTPRPRGGLHLDGQQSGALFDDEVNLDAARRAPVEDVGFRGDGFPPCVDVGKHEVLQEGAASRLGPELRRVSDTRQVSGRPVSVQYNFGDLTSRVVRSAANAGSLRI